MNLPNKLTMLRILLIPVFMVVLYWDFPGATWVAVAIFMVYVLVSDKDGRHGFKRRARLFQSLKNLFPRDPCIDQDGRTLVFY